MKLAYGNYGMPTTPALEMVQAVAGMGYDGLELCAAPGDPTAPDQLDAAARRDLRQALADAPLEIASIMVAKVRVLEPDPTAHAANLAYLRQVLELRGDLATSVEISSTLGGRMAEYETQRDLMAACVRDWAKVAAEYDAVFAFEPHVGGLIHSPERALWLLQAVAHPSLRLNFDYSHFELIDVALTDAIDRLIPYAAGVHVKDVQGRYPDFRFLLPGEGNLDYVRYLTLLDQAGYQGYITIEISGQVFGAAGYDALAAAQFSYATLAAAFTAAGLARG